MDGSWKKAVRGLALLLLVAVSCVVLIFPLVECARRYPVDFTNYYMSGKIVRDGQASRLYDAGLQHEVLRQVCPSTNFFMPYLHPPFEALLFAALAGLTYTHAFVAWGGLNLLLMGLVVYLLPFTRLRLRPAGYAVWIAVCMVFLLPVLGLGHDALALALVLLAAFLALKQRRDLLAGMILGLGLYRFEVLLPLAFIFLLRRRWRLFAGFTILGAIQLGISAAMVGWAGLAGYLRVLVGVGRAASGPWADPQSQVRDMPSLHGALSTLLGGALPSSFIFLLVFAGTLLLLGWAAWEFKSLDKPEDPAFGLAYCLAVTAALLSSYHVFVTELTPLIVVAYLMLGYEGSRGRESGLAVGPGVLLLLLFLGLFTLRAAINLLPFSAEIIPLLAMMVWLSRELSSLRKPAPAA